MMLRDIEPSIEERSIRALIKAEPACRLCGGTREKVGYTTCWDCYQREWRAMMAARGLTGL
jgi:hypothetical protein